MTDRWTWGLDSGILAAAYGPIHSSSITADERSGDLSGLRAYFPVHRLCQPTINDKRIETRRNDHSEPCSETGEESSII